MSKLSLKRADAETIDLFAQQERGKDTSDTPGRQQEKAPADFPPISADFVEELNDVQREAVTTTDGPVLVVAGAGSGKTRVLTYRIAYLLSRGIRPWNILSLTFTNKAAGEMKERIGSLVGADRARPLWMGTFHSVFSRLLRREAELLGYTSGFSIYDTEDSRGVIKQVMAGYGMSAQDYPPKMLQSRISSAKNSLTGVAAYRNQAQGPMEQKIALVYEAYQNRLRAANAMDFDDLLVKTIELFERNPDALKKYQNQFRYILIDEYQDTNRAQYVAVKMLAEGVRNICVVGDDAQSIYRFRGADIRNILDFERDYPGYRIFRLEQNYRSTKMILAAADDVIKNNRGQIEKTLWTENDEGEKIRVETLRDEREEGMEVLNIINREVRRGRKLSDIAVLYRINSQSLSIEDALRRNNVPYGLVGGVAFYQRKEVKDALAYVRLMVNPRDDESFNRVVNLPARGIGEVSLKRLRHFASERGIPLLQAAREAGTISGLGPRAANALVKFTRMIEHFADSSEDLEPAERVRGVLGDSGLLQSYQDEGTPEAVARWENVQRILSHIAEYTEMYPEAGLDQYLQEIALISDVDTWDTTVERVTLMTIHSAKGLEFPVVILVGLEEGLFPVGNAAQQQEDLEEERRLCYVAITRAKERLYITNCERRYRFGELSYPTPSRFLAEIKDDRLEFNVTAPPRRSEGGFGGSRPRRGTTYRKTAVPPPDNGSQIPSDEDYSQIPMTLQVGSRVYHQNFGEGKVEKIEGSGEKTKVTVRFPEAGRKQLMLKFAGLRVVG